MMWLHNSRQCILWSHFQHCVLDKILAFASLSKGWPANSFIKNNVIKQVAKIIDSLLVKCLSVTWLNTWPVTHLCCLIIYLRSLRKRCKSYKSVNFLFTSIKSIVDVKPLNNAVPCYLIQIDWAWSVLAKLAFNRQWNL